MSDASANRDDWKQFAEDVAACACSVARALIPEGEAARRVQNDLLRAQANILRGLLGLVEGRLARLDATERPRAEKVKIE